MIEVSEMLLVEKYRAQALRGMTDRFMSDPDKQRDGRMLKYALRYLDLWDGSDTDKDTKKEDNGMSEKNINLADEIAAMEERDRLKSLLDRVDAGDMQQKEAVAYALAYFDGVSDVDADKPYTAGDILSLMYALYKCEA